MIMGKVGVRFATFNIRNGRGIDGLNSWPIRRRSTAAAIAALDADVLGLQEVFEWQRRYLDRRLPGRRWFGQGREGGSEGEQCPIAVANEAISVTRQQTRWFGPTPDVPRTRLPGASFPRVAVLMRCRDARSGLDFDVVNTHLDEHIDANRAASVRQLVEWVDPAMPTVIMGDFNTVPTNTPVLGALADAGFHHVDVSGGTEHRFTGRADGKQIDHIYVSRHWQIKEAAVIRRLPGRRLPSDHWPVRATLVVAAAH